MFWDIFVRFQDKTIELSKAHAKIEGQQIFTASGIYFELIGSLNLHRIRVLN